MQASWRPLLWLTWPAQHSCLCTQLSVQFSSCHQSWCPLQFPGLRSLQVDRRSLSDQTGPTCLPFSVPQKPLLWSPRSNHSTEPFKSVSSFSNNLWKQFNKIAVFPWTTSVPLSCLCPFSPPFPCLLQYQAEMAVPLSCCNQKNK